MTISILGTEYTVLFKKYDEDEAFERRSIDGYHDGLAKQIVYCDMSTYKGWEHEPPETAEASQKETLRHEIVHAFLHESGLAYSSLNIDGAWAKKRGNGGLDCHSRPENLESVAGGWCGMTEYRAIFKCRLCGETYESGCTGGAKAAMDGALSACIGKQLIPNAPCMNEVHNCKDGGLGIADFQGFRVVVA